MLTDRLRNVVWLTSLVVAASMSMAQSPSTNPTSRNLPLAVRGVYFVPNQGQWSDADVLYGFRSHGLDIAFRDSSLTMHMAQQATDASPKRERGVPDDDLTLTLTFPGSHDVLPVGAKPQAAKFNYFVGGEGRTTASDVPSFGEVVYASLYDGIDLHIAGNDDGILKYEFHVAPGADYTLIRIHYDGIESLCIDDTGDLHINTRLGTLADSAPLVWQRDDGPSPSLGSAGEGWGGGASSPPVSRSRTGAAVDIIPARFELCDDHTYHIALDAPADPTRELIIDPDIDWMTYLGGSRYDEGEGIATDAAGNALVGGHTDSSNFEGHNNTYHGMSDTFIVKLDPTGHLLWMTYLGGSSLDFAWGIATDAAGNALVTGQTESVDFEGRNNEYHGGGLREEDAFVVKVDPAGHLLWMTYLGGGDDEAGLAIAMDAAGNALVTGDTLSGDFEGHNNTHHGGYRDAFVVKVGSDGYLNWMTYLGGNSFDDGYGITSDAAGNARVTGYTYSSDFEGRQNSDHRNGDAFVASVDSDAHIQWMTYLGGTNIEKGLGIATDAAGNSVVTGWTHSTDFEGRNNTLHGDQDAFVVKVDSQGLLQWMTYLGGSAVETGRGIALDAQLNSLAIGETSSTNFEGSNNAPHGSKDAFVVKVDSQGLLQWMTYLGGSAVETGNAIALDADDNSLVTGATTSTDFEGQNNANHGLIDRFVVKVRAEDSGGPQLTVNATCPSGGPIQVSWTGATGGGNIALLYARTTGSFVIPNNHPCDGTPLGLSTNRLQLAYRGSAGPDGSRTLNSNTGPGACGGYLQLLDISTCNTSNVAPLQ